MLTKPGIYRFSRLFRPNLRKHKLQRCILCVLLGGLWYERSSPRENLCFESKAGRVLQYYRSFPWSAQSGKQTKDFGLFQAWSPKRNQTSSARSHWTWFEGLTNNDHEVRPDLLKTKSEKEAIPTMNAVCFLSFIVLALGNVPVPSGWTPPGSFVYYAYM